MDTKKCEHIVIGVVVVCVRIKVILLFTIDYYDIYPNHVVSLEVGNAMQKFLHAELHFAKLA